MKIKTSITIEAAVLSDLDLAARGSNRSAVIEEAVKDYLAQRQRQARAARDLEIINQRADRLNAEAEDVLHYQGDML